MITAFIATTGPADTSTGWIEVALIIFFVVFVLVSISVILRRRGHFDRAARIPLSDDMPPADGEDSSQGAAP